MITKDNSISIRGFKFPTLDPKYLVYNVFYDNNSLPQDFLNEFYQYKSLLRKSANSKIAYSLLRIV